MGDVTMLLPAWRRFRLQIVCRPGQAGDAASLRRGSRHPVA
jgi:hypothetical protein